VVVCRYQKLWKQYIRLKHLVANKPKVLLKDREKLRSLEDQLQEIRLKGHVLLTACSSVAAAQVLISQLHCSPGLLTTHL